VGLGAKAVPFGTGRKKKKTDFQPDLQENRQENHRQKPASSIFNSPNNPTGTVFDDSGTRRHRCSGDNNKHDLWVLTDENLCAHSLLTAITSPIRLLPRNGRTHRHYRWFFKKALPMTGWRLGYAVAPVQVIDAHGSAGAQTLLTCAAEFTQVCCHRSSSRH